MSDDGWCLVPMKLSSRAQREGQREIPLDKMKIDVCPPKGNDSKARMTLFLEGKDWKDTLSHTLLRVEDTAIRFWEHG